MILSVLAGISYPSMSAAIDSLRINNASTDVAAIFNTALNRAERRQHAIEVTILSAEGVILLASPDPRFHQRLDMLPGVSILAVLPEVPGDPRLPRQFLLFPGGTVPRIGVLLGNTRGDRRLVRVDPITGIPQIERAALP
jgi:hypothetical protein